MRVSAAEELVLAAEAVLLDFDGLVIDTEYAGWRSWSDIYAAYGLTLPEAEWARQCGRPVLFEPWGPLEETGRPVDREALLVRHHQRKEELLVLLPGVHELLDHVEALGHRAGIVSNSPEEWIAKNLARHGLSRERFAVVICGDALPAKPSPARYLAALDALGLRPGQAIAVEDSAKGIDAAVAAGLRCVAVPSRITRHSDLSAADHLVSTLERLRLVTTASQGSACS